jgi:hypothetical protein
MTNKLVIRTRTSTPIYKSAHLIDSLVDPVVLPDPSRSNFDRTPFSASSLSYPVIVAVVDVRLSIRPTISSPQDRTLWPREVVGVHETN